LPQSTQSFFSEAFPNVDKMKSDTSVSNINQGCINKQSGQLPDSWFTFKAKYKPILRKMLDKSLKTFGYKHWQSHKLWLSLSCSTSTMQRYTEAQWAKWDHISLNSNLRHNI